MKNFIILVIKRNDRDLVSLFIFFVALLGVSILSETLKSNGVKWYWVLAYNFLFLIFLRGGEILLSVLLSSWNRKVHIGFYVLAIVASALLTTFIF